MAKETRSDQINTFTRVCDICSELDARFCLTCNASYCEDHVEDHLYVPALQKHVLLEKNQGPEQRLCVEPTLEKHDVEEIKQTASQVKTRKRRQNKAKTSVLPPPGDIKFLSISRCSVTLSWGRPEGLEGSHVFKLRWECDGKQSSLKLKDVYQVEVRGLKPAEVKFNVATVGMDGEQSTWVSKSVVTEIPPPEHLWVEQHGKTQFTLNWSTPRDMTTIPHNFLVSCRSMGTDPKITYTETKGICLDLEPDIEYILGVSTVLNNGEVSQPVSKTIWTVLPVLEMLAVTEIGGHGATLQWQNTAVDVHITSYRMCYHRKGAEKEKIEVHASSPWTLWDLQPATEYNVSVCAAFDQEVSECVSTTFTTGIERR